MSITNQNFSFYAGDDKELVFEVTDELDEIVDVAGMTARFSMAAYEGGAAVLEKEISTIAASSPPDGLVSVELDQTDTDDFTPQAYYYQVVLIDANSPANEDVIATGWIELKPRVANI